MSREQLRSLLWSENIFVDFETGLNTAVKRLRETIGDSADNPTFIETVPRRGYKFIAPVEVVVRTEKKSAAAVPPVNRKGKKVVAIASIALAALLSVAGVITWRAQPRIPRVVKVVQVTNDGKAKIPNNLFITDGVHLYFMEGTPFAGGSKIAQVSVVGGDTTEVATPLKEILAIAGASPDFSQLLVVYGVGVQADPDSGRPGGASEVWVQPLPAGAPHRVGKIYATSACFTPDGTHILYTDGQALITIDTDGSNPHELAKLHGMVRDLSYSPDGNRIRYQVQDSPGEFDSGTLWEIDSNGNNPHQLLPNWKESPSQCCGNWSPDGTYYFQAGHGKNQAIWTIPPERRFSRAVVRPSRLISGPLRLSAPVPSADGKKLFVIGTQPRVEPVRYDSKLHRYESYLNGISTSSFEI